MDRPDDWQCPDPSCQNHSKMVFGTKSTCPKCGAPQPRGGGCGSLVPRGGFGDFGGGGRGGGDRVSGGDNPEDWSCPNPDCMNHTKMVFAKHDSCPKCGTGRNAQKPGDWCCPNMQCVNHKNTVFASKISCPKCHAPRPGTMGAFGAGMPPAHSYGAFKGGGCSGCGGYGAAKGGYGARPTPFGLPQRAFPQPFYGAPPPFYGAPPPMMGNTPRFGGGGGGGVTMNPGDWNCPNADCQNHRNKVFAKHTSCPQCGCDKPDPQDLGGRAGDWKCPNQECQNHRNNVFGKHLTCPKCGTDKPAEPMNGIR